MDLEAEGESESERKRARPSDSLVQQKKQQQSLLFSVGDEHLNYAKRHFFKALSQKGSTEEKEEEDDVPNDDNNAGKEEEKEEVEAKDRKTVSAKEKLSPLIQLKRHLDNAFDRQQSTSFIIVGASSSGTDKLVEHALTMYGREYSCWSSTKRRIAKVNGHLIETDHEALISITNQLVFHQELDRLPNARGDHVARVRQEDCAPQQGMKGQHQRGAWRQVPARRCPQHRQ